MAKTPATTSSSGEIARFLEKTRTIQQFVERNPRLLFAIDATASRQPTWDMACHLQGSMFRATAKVASLSVQLCYFQGDRRFRASAWTSSTEELAATMRRVRCEAGQTQIARVLKHGLREHGKTPVRALVFIGDAMEESAATLLDLAGQCGLRKLPLFLFQEGKDGRVHDCFSSMARVSGGASCSFDQRSADILEQLLGAVARYAAGGPKALENNPTEGAKLLLRQLKS